ncbi:fumarate reductase flavoprotein subunit [Vibrio cholerae]|nr:fumarate reductase flavoprotein subunit [Vibrio cholerae]
MQFLKHSLAFYQEGQTPKIDYSPVKITKSQPKARLYGEAAEKAAAAEAAGKSVEEQK